jgi:hypothetical protein
MTAIAPTAVIRSVRRRRRRRTVLEIARQGLRPGSGLRGLRTPPVALYTPGGVKYQEHTGLRLRRSPWRAAPRLGRGRRFSGNILSAYGTSDKQARIQDQNTPPRVDDFPVYRYPAPPKLHNRGFHAIACRQLFAAAVESRLCKIGCAPSLVQGYAIGVTCVTLCDIGHVTDQTLTGLAFPAGVTV